MKFRNQLFSLIGSAAIASTVAGAAEAASLGGVGSFDDGTTEWTTQLVTTDEGTTLEFLSLAATVGQSFGSNPYALAGWRFASSEDVQELWDGFGFGGEMGDTTTGSEIISEETLQRWFSSMGQTDPRVSLGFYGEIEECGFQPPFDSFQCMAGVSRSLSLGPVSQDQRSGQTMNAIIGNYLVRDGESTPASTPEPGLALGAAVALGLGAVARRRKLAQSE